MLETIVFADDVETGIFSLMDQIAKVGRKLEIKCVFSATHDLVFADNCLAGKNHVHRLESKGICVIAVENDNSVLLRQIQNSTDTFRFDVFIVNKIGGHSFSPFAKK